MYYDDNDRCYSFLAVHERRTWFLQEQQSFRAVESQKLKLNVKAYDIVKVNILRHFKAKYIHK